MNSPKNLARAGVYCFYQSEVLNPGFVHLMKYSAKKTRLRKAANLKGNRHNLKGEL